MDTNEKILNDFLTDIFNKVLKTEESILKKGRFKDLSIREMHVIELVGKKEIANENNASNIAKSLSITPGTLTTTVRILEEKGYLIRKKSKEDKRVVKIFTTDIGKNANKRHSLFHEKLAKEMLSLFPEEEKTILIEAVKQLDKFFIG